MTSQHWTDRLSEYVDGDLSRADVAALELHLLECDVCAETVAELRHVVAEAAVLEDREPPADLWPRIADRLAPRSALASPEEDHEHDHVHDHDPAGDAVSLDAHRRARPVHRRIALTVPQLLAAGIALVLFSAGGVWMAVAPATAGPGPLAGTTAEAPTPAAVGGATGDEAARAVPATFTAAYEAAITELETAFEQQRTRLEPETIRVVERNLAIIDAAIAEARHALEEDPASGFLNTHLANAMRRKVDLLRQAARIERMDI